MERRPLHRAVQGARHPVHLVPGRSAGGSIQDVPKLIRASLGGVEGSVAAQLAPSRGWLDFAAPVLSAINNAVLGWLPTWVQILLWAALASFISMGIYRLTSSQTALADVKEKIAATRNDLQGFDGEFSELWPILKRNLALAGKHLGLTFVPAMIASLPVLFILAWMSNAFDARMPAPGAVVPVTLTPAAGHTLPPVSWQGDATAHETSPGTWAVTWPAEGSNVRLVDSDGSSAAHPAHCRPGPGRASARVVEQPDRQSRRLPAEARRRRRRSDRPAAAHGDPVRAGLAARAGSRRA